MNHFPPWLRTTPPSVLPGVGRIVCPLGEGALFEDGRNRPMTDEHKDKLRAAKRREWEKRHASR